MIPLPLTGMETLLSNVPVETSPGVLIPLPLTGMETLSTCGSHIRLPKSFDSFTPYGDGNLCPVVAVLRCYYLVF